MILRYLASLRGTPNVWRTSSQLANHFGTNSNHISKLLHPLRRERLVLSQQAIRGLETAINPHHDLNQQYLNQSAAQLAADAKAVTDTAAASEVPVNSRKRKKKAPVATTQPTAESNTPGPAGVSSVHDAGLGTGASSASGPSVAESSEGSLTPTDEGTKRAVGKTVWERAARALTLDDLAKKYCGSAPTVEACNQSGGQLTGIDGPIAGGDTGVDEALIPELAAVLAKMTAEEPKRQSLRDPQSAVISLKWLAKGMPPALAKLLNEVSEYIAANNGQ